MVDETTKEVLECFPSVTNYERFQKTMDAIHSRSKVVLRRVLFDLFVSDISDPETLQSRIHELVAERYEYMYAESNENPLPTKRKSEESPKKKKRRGKKRRKTATYISEGPDECTRCEEEFGPEDESKGCFRHPGIMQLNRASYSWWTEEHIETSEYTSKELNAPHHREENPDGFTWSCCGLPGGRRGCKRCPHKAYEGDTDYSGDSEDSDEVDDDSGSSDEGNESDSGQDDDDDEDD
ncbi:hypothetical protein NEUTE1DRAFT_80763 [Neurospora tetrasperma FGSC 2508]|uniref:Uncharacterized protein n=1 Tax=Neurospora tetrasperma (strain FGSC 2508 / ATCC MYA-4615 / P0657) TaxID=510951 RepID=F8MJM2_NEUT8|nr:uncharacterized protein NEUTE1DRAFT_80763 [Neurospora tetrasperma FGSC 2508]EGO57263.1 hypothetical protein NEUTE1DRAFT_80763 [Neurospora tetrasperma FGSC 2508]EGZ72490.1 hypothetical protein NEUTE2DRAFT_90731 [Neurospora tetrasperma FGSC 2509]